MKIYVYDVDDTLVHHTKDNIDYYKVKTPPHLADLIKNSYADHHFIYTNGTYGHGDKIVKNLKIDKLISGLYARDSIPYMKPLMKSFKHVLYDMENIIGDINNEYYFFEDSLENLQMGKIIGWTTILIHPEYNKMKEMYSEFVDYAFPNIYQALITITLKEAYG